MRTIRSFVVWVLVAVSGPLLGARAAAKGACELADGGSLESAIPSGTAAPGGIAVTATGSTTPRTLADRFADELNVKDFGAHSVDEPGFAKFDSTSAIQAAITALPSAGGTIRFPRGVYGISSPLTLRDRRSTRLVGAGAGHATLGTGTLLRWVGGAGGTLLELNGWSDSTVEHLALDGSAKTAARGIYIHKGPTTYSQKNQFNQITVAGFRTGMQIGITDGNDTTNGNNDQTSCYDCWFRDNDTGVLWQGDQAVHWQFYNVQVINSAVAGFRTGEHAPNGGAFNVFGGSFGGNAIDFDLPRFNDPIMIEGVRDENGGIVLRSDSTAGDEGRTLTMRNFWQKTRTHGADSIIFRSGNSLQIEDSRFDGNVLIDQKALPSTSVRTFINTYYGGSLVREGPTHPYRIVEINKPAHGVTNNSVTAIAGDVSAEKLEIAAGGDVSVRNASHAARSVLRLNGEVGVHGSGGPVAVGSGVTYILGPASELNGLLLVHRVASDRIGLFLVHSGDAVVELNDPSNIFSAVKGTKGSLNLFVDRTRKLVLENLSGSEHRFYFAHLGGL